MKVTWRRTSIRTPALSSQALVWWHDLPSLRGQHEYLQEGNLDVILSLHDHLLHVTRDPSIHLYMNININMCPKEICPWFGICLVLTMQRRIMLRMKSVERITKTGILGLT